MYRYAQEAGCRLHARAFVNVIVLSVVQAMAVPTQRYTWDQVPIGGGGAIPTVVAHPVVRDAVFTTHDVCGPYRYSAARSRFEYLCGQFDWSTKTNRQAHGTECLVVDPTDVTGNTIYATLGEWANVPEGHGLFKSTDRGTTWTKANYAACMTATDQFGAVQHIAVDPANESRIVTIGPSDAFYYSTNGGVTWTALNAKSRWNKAAPWYPDWLIGVGNAAHPFSGSLAFDADGNFWYSDWYQVWRCADLDASTVEYRSMIRGIEEMVCIGQSVACPPSGRNFLYVGVADDWGFGISSLSEFPATSLQALDVNVLSFDYQESNPQFVVACGMEGWNGNSGGGYSTDGGATWTRFASIPGNTTGGRVAVSAQTERILWQHSGGLFYSNDRGRTWNQSPGVGGWGQSQIFNTPEAYLVADRRNGNKFYRLDGSVRRSSDGGASWQIGAGGGLDLRSLFVNHLRENEVWAVDWDGGLHRSTDGGATLRQLGGVSALDASFGKGPSPDVASLYVIGAVGGVTGIYRSDDHGATWIDISDRLAMPGNDPSHIIGDRQVYGRCFVTTGGTGVYFGAPEGTVVVPPPPPPARRDTVQVVRVAQGPVLDGAIDAVWSSAQVQTDSLVTLGSRVSTADFDASFRMAWDDDNLYALVEVADDVAGTSAANAWENDAVEIYIESSNSTASSYGTSGFQYLFARGSQTVTEFRHQAVSGVRVAQGAASAGYIVEIAIPWSTLGASASSGAGSASTVMWLTTMVRDAKPNSPGTPGLTAHGRAIVFRNGCVDGCFGCCARGIMCRCQRECANGGVHSRWAGAQGVGRQGPGQCRGSLRCQAQRCATCAGGTLTVAGAPVGARMVRAHS